jgi:hypothetical protein
LLEVFGEAAVSAQPCQRPLDDPTAREDHETLGRIGTLDDLDGPFADPERPGTPYSVSPLAGTGTCSRDKLASPVVDINLGLNKLSP